VVFSAETLTEGNGEFQNCGITTGIAGILGYGAEMVTRSVWVRLVLLATIYGFLVSNSEAHQAAHSVERLPDLLWQFHVDGAISTNPVADGELLFVASDLAKTYALEKKTGKEIWTYDPRADGMTALGGEPLVSQNLVIVGAND